MPRVKQFDQQEVLQKAMQVFWKKGYNGTSMSELVGELGISRGSFYDTFENKRDLFDKALAAYRGTNYQVLESILASEENPKAGLQKLFQMNLDQAISDPDFKGCLLANTCSEMGGSDEMIKDILQDHYEKMHAIFTDYIRKAGTTKGVSAEAVADLFLTLLTGINQEVKFKRERKNFEHSIELAMGLLA